MANQSIHRGDIGMIERWINFTGSLFAKVQAIIPYDSSEAELFTAANPGTVDLQPATSGGVSSFNDPDLDETAVVVKADAGMLLGFYVINLHTAPVYLKFYNVAQGSVTVGSTAIEQRFCIPSQGDANGGGAEHWIEYGGKYYDTAITVAATTDYDGNGAPGANLVHVEIYYK